MPEETPEFRVRTLEPEVRALWKNRRSLPRGNPRRQRRTARPSVRGGVHGERPARAGRPPRGRRRRRRASLRPLRRGRRHVALRTSPGGRGPEPDRRDPRGPWRLDRRVERSSVGRRRTSGRDPGDRLPPRPARDPRRAGRSAAPLSFLPSAPHAGADHLPEGGRRHVPRAVPARGDRSAGRRPRLGRLRRGDCSGRAPCSCIPRSRTRSWRTGTRGRARCCSRRTVPSTACDPGSPTSSSK